MGFKNGFKISNFKISNYENITDDTFNIGILFIKSGKTTSALEITNMTSKVFL